MYCYIMSLAVSVMFIITGTRNAAKSFHHNKKTINGDTITDSVR